MSNTVFNVSQQAPKGLGTQLKAYQALNSTEAAIVRCVAIAGELTRVELGSCLEYLAQRHGTQINLAKTPLNKALLALQEQRLLNVSHTLVTCEPFLGERICREWFADEGKRDWLEWINRAIELNAPRKRYENPFNSISLRDFRLALYAKEPNSANATLIQQAFSDDTFPAACGAGNRGNLITRTLLMPWDAAWFATLPLFSQSVLLTYLLLIAEVQGKPFPDSDALICRICTPDNPHAADTTTSMAVRHYLLANNFEKAAALIHPSTFLGKLRQGQFLLFSGEASAAAQTFEEAVAQEAKAQKKRKFELPFPYRTFYLFALLGMGTPESRQAMVEKSRLGKDHHNIIEIALAYLGQGLATGTRHTPPYQLERAPYLRLLQLVLHTWMEGENKEYKAELLKAVTDLAREAEQCGQAWVELQARDLVARLRDKPSPLVQAGQFALSDLYQPEPAWQRILNALLTINDTRGPAANANTETRLVWVLEKHRNEVSGLTPKEQKRSKGGWTKGRAASLKRLTDEQDELPYLTPIDKQVLQKVEYRHDNYWGAPDVMLPLDVALPALVGHPLVFWEDGEIRVDIVRGDVHLRVTESAGHIQLALTPAPPHSDQLSFWQLETPTRLVVYPLSPQIVKIAGLLANGLKIPAKARAQITDALATLAPTLPIHSDIAFSGENLETVAADPCLYLHLLPCNDGLQVQARVRPLPEGNWYPPGRGSELVIGEQNGKSVQARRDIKHEKKALATLEATCTTLVDAEGESPDWHFNDAENSLEFLLQMRQLDAQFQPLWPEGQRFKLRAEVSEQDLSLKISKQQDWFAVNGDIQVDEKQVLSLQQLLNLLSQTKGRFLPLGDNEYIAITSQLRKRLDDLRGYAERGKQELSVPALGAHVLGDLVENAGKTQVDKAWRDQLQRIRNADTETHDVPVTLQAELRDYQIDGFRWLARMAARGAGACLADDMGLGKTLQALTLLLHRAPKGPALVVAPTSLCLNWKAEAERFAPTLRMRTYHDERHLDHLQAFDVVLVSYGLLQSQAEAFHAQQWHTLVLDEAQAIKNAQAKRTKAVQQLQGEMRVVCTGTPLENHLGELWSLFRFLNPGLLGSQDAFNERYANPIERGDNAARKRLKRLIQPFFLRRTKTEVLAELPPRVEVVYPVQLSAPEIALYEATRRQALEAVSAASGKGKDARFQMLAEITRLRRLCCHPDLVMPEAGLSSAKMEAFAELVSDLLDNHHKALVFSQFVDVLSKAREVLEKQNVSYQYLDGATPQAERKKRVDAFQAGQGDVFLISLKAGGTGLNLTAADYVIHLDPWWNPAVEDQASDRAHRMGQTRPVTIYRLVAKDTIEERIVSLHAKKRELADSLLADGDAGARVGADELLALLKEERGLV